MTEQRTNHIPRIRVTDAERAEVERRAAAAGVSLTDYIRNTVIGGDYDGTPILGTIQDERVIVFPGVCPRCLGFGEVLGFKVQDGGIVPDRRPCPLCKAEGQAA